MKTYRITRLAVVAVVGVGLTAAFVAGGGSQQGQERSAPADGDRAQVALPWPFIMTPRKINCC